MISEKEDHHNDITAYDTLAPFERHLLQLISVIYEPVSVSFLFNCLSRADAPFPDDPRPSKDEFRLIISRLHAAGLLIDGNRCPAHLAERLTRKAVENGLFGDLAAFVEREASVSYMYGKLATRCWRAMRQFRIGVYSGDFDKIDQALAFINEQCAELAGKEPPAVLVAARDFDAKWFGGLPRSMQFFLLNQICRYSVEHLQHYGPVLEYLEKESAMAHAPDELVPFHRLLATYLLLQGRFIDLQGLLQDHGASFEGAGFSGTLAFLLGDTDKALALYEQDLKLQQEYSGRQDNFFFGLPGLFFLLALLDRNREGDRAAIRHHVATVMNLFRGSLEETSFRFIDAVVRSAGSDMPDMMVLTEQLKAENRFPTTLFAVLSLYWIGVEIPDDFQASLIALYQEGLANGFSWPAMEAARLLGELGNGNAQYGEAAEELRRDLGCRTIVNIIEPQGSWKHSLQELISITSRVRESEQTTRLVWLVDYRDGVLHITPKEQMKKAGGGWSKGRSIALSRLAAPGELDFLTAQDRRICAALWLNSEVSTKVSGYCFDLDVALPAMVGHPLIFLEKSVYTPVELLAGEPELLVEQQGSFLFIRFTQDIGEGKVAVWQETPTRFRIILVNDNHRRVAGITGRDGLRVPMSASRQVLDAIGNIASFMTVHSSIGIDLKSQRAEVVEADSTTHVHLIPYGTGFRLEMFVQPFSRVGPYLKPGVGVANVMAEVNGRRQKTRRDLKLEEEKAREVEESCPILDLAIDMEEENDREWHLIDPEECLQILLELDAIRDRVILEWPEGEKLAVYRQAGVNQLNLNIRTSQQDWFALSGRLEIDQDEVIELKTLFEKVQAAHSRFIPMGDGQFLALTQEFRKRLDELILVADSEAADSGDEVFVHPLAALALDGLTSKAKTTVDEGWRRQLQSIKETQEMVPEVPSTLQAELRDYQTDGFVWMTRLAHLGVGACLADDMGLGKTLQTLAVILYLTHKGPSLVVAPTSVCMNWEHEINRFAPTLRIHFLSGADRQNMVKTLGKFDVLITSYTLLQQEVELLESVPWQIVVLDEGQSIKNSATKRSKAAMRLKGKFCLITTGTPIENHLGELWNLFRFINPGLLGSYKQFNARFGIPIEKHHDRDARMRLKKIIRPFMLRRIKSQVLDELPPRTEVTLRVEMSREEIQFYEAIRRQALENIECSSEKSGRHLQILAEIMRLRRACCNPRLIMPDTKIPSKKLEVFAELVDELLGGRHKALVFSQFTGHLALIREYLDNKGIVYKYLDGTTPTRERQQQVESFQAGEGDLFLISLKAGGLGLNLTAADYVIHMDPWWNPAVEDQAADRAHRIGQKRPVTVYRLVTANTIEDKIVRLHQEKRDLANSLLEGADVSARISAAELLELIRES
ncbi:MAG: ATP-dependent helicase [Proteobacteria bacterium]|nr:ATP-dependent helicase [Pseudomonadota bacterium]